MILLVCSLSAGSLPPSKCVCEWVFQHSNRLKRADFKADRVVHIYILVTALKRNWNMFNSNCMCSSIIFRYIWTLNNLSLNLQHSKVSIHTWLKKVKGDIFLQDSYLSTLLVWGLSPVKGCMCDTQRIRYRPSGWDTFLCQCADPEMHSATARCGWKGPQNSFCHLLSPKAGAALPRASLAGVLQNLPQKTAPQSSQTPLLVLALEYSS